ncbi:MAG: cobyrinate a,c-diamide synthase [Pseudomonadota bacterium]
MPGRGLILAAPSSGSGKTTVTLGLLRALTRRGVAVRGAKSGPDYIDPRFHEAACGQPCMNLDAWAMTPDRVRALAETRDLLLVEGAMGLFDGAPPTGQGATADLARILDLPVVLIVDAGRMSHSVAALVHGFASYDPDVHIAGVILNRVGSERHATMLRAALARLDIPVLGALPRAPDLAHPSRHLGLVQASERPDLSDFLDKAADLVASSCEIERIVALATPRHTSTAPRMRPPGQRIALAQDTAFAFSYPHLVQDWSDQGAEIFPFSPLADQAVPQSDVVFLPGGYPELYGGTLAGNTTFMQSLNNAAQNTDIYGECGGYMVLGDGLIDADGTHHAMAGLLPLETSFAARHRHLGYRTLRATHGPFPGTYRGHEFHYATTLRAEGPTLFEAWDAEGNALAPMGLRQGRVCGSFAHLIDLSPPSRKA